MRRGRTDTLDGISTLSGNHEFKDDDEEEGDDEDMDDEGENLKHFGTVQYA